MLNLSRVMKAKAVAGDLPWLPSPHKQCYLTSFPPVIHFHPCPCPHMFFWSWRIRRLQWVLWVTSMLFPESCLSGGCLSSFSFPQVSFFSNSIKVDMATTTEVYMSSHAVFQKSFKPSPSDTMLKVSEHSDQKFLPLLHCLAKSEEQIAACCV